MAMTPCGARPQVLLVAGMRAEELPRVRQLIDELGGHTVKVLPVRCCRGCMQSAALQLDS